MDAIIRLQNEFINVQKNLSFGCHISPTHKTKNTLDWMHWEGQIFYGGLFYQIELTFTKKYPQVPPQVKFISPVFNPNVYSRGQVCLDIIQNKWKPSMSVTDVMKGLIQLLKYPNPSSPANETAAKLFVKDVAKFNEKVREVARETKYKIRSYWIDE